MRCPHAAAVWKVRESFSVAHVPTVLDTVHVHIANAVVDRDIHAKRILEVSYVQTHLANLLPDEDIPIRVLLRERFVLFRLLYVQRAPPLRDAPRFRGRETPPRPPTRFPHLLLETVACDQITYKMADVAPSLQTILAELRFAMLKVLKRFSKRL